MLGLISKTGECTNIELRQKSSLYGKVAATQIWRRPYSNRALITTAYLQLESLRMEAQITNYGLTAKIDAVIQRMLKRIKMWPPTKNVMQATAQTSTIVMVPTGAPPWIVAMAKMER